MYDSDYSIDTASPEELWDRLNGTVKARINLRAGTILEWWTSLAANGRPGATVLGTNALVRVEPVSGDDGAPANRITAVAIDPASIDRARVRTPHGWQQPVTPADRRRSEFIDVLGQLPGEAQKLLRHPFLDSPPQTVRRDQYYSRARTQELAHSGETTLRVWYCISDQRAVTFAAGLGFGFRAGTGAKAWDVTCWRAAVKAP